MTSLIEAAHDYARRGWRVIPLHRVGPDGRTCSCNKGGNCTSKGKHPIDNGWQKAQRLAGPEIQETWDRERPPNLGIATGVESGFWVLDIDPKGGGLESMAELVAAHGPMPPTLVFQTGSDGYHYGFEMPEFEVRNDQSGRVGPGIDVRGQGGQIVAPPSRTDKGDYRVVTDLPPAPAPQWLLDLVRKENRSDIAVVTIDDLPKPEDLDEAEWKRLSAYAKRIVDLELARFDECKAAATPNPNDYRGPAWNHTTFEVACTLIEIANSPWNSYSLGQAQRDILERAPQDAEFDKWVINKTIGSALERIGDKARAIPEDRKKTQAVEPDPMFSGPDVRNPTEGSGTPAVPAVRIPGQIRFFGGDRGKEPLYQEMAEAIFELGPVGYGVNRDFWVYKDGVWSPDEYVLQDRLNHLLGNAWREGHAANAKTPVRVRATPITAEPLETMMNFRNGMLEWRTGEFFDHDPGYRSTIQLACDWDPDATCPKFEAWLAATLHPDYVKLAWEMIGYLMKSGNEKHRAFLLYGVGGSGKSTLLRLITHLLGEQNVAAETLDALNGNRFRAASLFGRIANIAGDIDATYQENTAMFKSITGQDRITVENKGEKPFRFTNWAVPVWSANKIPGSADVTVGYMRRWVVLRFTQPVDAKDRVDDLEKQFFDELPGIAAHGVRSLRDMQERGDFYEGGEVIKGKEEFAMAIDQVRQWIADGEVMAGPEIETELKKLYASYTIWAERAGVRRLRESEFSLRLDDIGFTSTKVAGSIFHKGISVPAILGHATTAANFFGGTNDTAD